MVGDYERHFFSECFMKHSRPVPAPVPTGPGARGAGSSAIARMYGFPGWPWRPGVPDGGGHYGCGMRRT